MRCSRPSLHNFSDLYDETKCSDCGKTVFEAILKPYIENHHSCPLCISIIIVDRIKINSEVMAKCKNTKCDFNKTEFDILDYESLYDEIKGTY